MCRRIILLFLLCFPTLTQARDQAIMFTKDSMVLEANEKTWRLATTDLPNGADTSLDDRQWPLTSSHLTIRDSGRFQGIGWLRLHFNSDSSVAGMPMLLSMIQTGASQVYLDGKRIGSFGRLSSNRDSVEYENPGRLARLFTMPPAGHHVVAVRYANYKWKQNAARFGEPAGFTMTLGLANGTLPVYVMQMYVQHWAFIFLLTFFLAFAILHLLLFFFRRSDKSNLWFSLFCWSFSLLFINLYVMRYSTTPAIQMYGAWLGQPIGLMACWTMSGLINALFSHKKLRFHIIGAICALTLGLYFFSRAAGAIMLMVLISVVSLEAVIVVIRAIIRKVKGAKIVGAGILFFCLFLLFLYILFIASGGDFEINDTTLLGAILFLTLILSILSIPIFMSAYLAWNFARISKDLSQQLHEVERLSAKALEAEAEKQKLLEARSEELELQVAERTASLRMEKQKSDDLLLNILPAEIAEELKEKGRSEARLYNDVTVLFTDFVDFTQKAEALSPAALVAEIDSCFKAFDDIIERHGLEKIKTVGDAYIAASGLPVENPSHAQAVVAAALEIRSFIADRKESHPQSFSIRLGIHSGPVVAGIVGVKKFAYDIWGDTVNTAARMEQHSEAGKINISNATYELVKDIFRCSYRGELEAKHKGHMSMYFVEG